MNALAEGRGTALPARDDVARDVRFVVRSWETINAQRGADEIVFARGRHVTLLGRDYALDVAAFLGVRRHLIERIRTSASRRVWLFVATEGQGVAIFVGDGQRFTRADGGADV